MYNSCNEYVVAVPLSHDISEMKEYGETQKSHHMTSGLHFYTELWLKFNYSGREIDAAMNEGLCGEPVNATKFQGDLLC